jgi:hypothetical protein
MARWRSGKELIWLGTAVLVIAVTVGIAPFLLPKLVSAEALADSLGGDRLWAVKGPQFITSELCDRWHLWAVGLLAVAGVLVVTGGWLAARQRRTGAGRVAEIDVAPEPDCSSGFRV